MFPASRPAMGKSGVKSHVDPHCVLTSDTPMGGLASSVWDRLAVILAGE